MLASLVSIVVAGVKEVGGWDVVWQRSKDTDRLNFLM
jgi:hypothetical protein